MQINSSLKISFWKVTVYLLIVIAGILVFLHFAEIRHLAKLFKEGGPVWIILAVLCQTLTYVFTGLCYRSLLSIFGGKNFLSLKDSFKSSVIMVSLAQLIPAYNVSDNGFFIYFLHKRGFDIKKSAQVVILEILLYYLAFFLLFIFGLVYLVFHPQISKLYLRAAYLFSLLILFFGIFVFWFFTHKNGLNHLLKKISKFISKAAPHIDWEKAGDILETNGDKESAVFVVKNRRGLLVKPFIFRFLVFLMDALTIYFLFYAFNTPIYFGMAAIVFALSQAVGIFSIGPAGLGFFEGAMIFFFQNLFLSLDVVVAATLLFRALSFWLPMPLGIWLYSKIMNNNNNSVNTSC